MLVWKVNRETFSIHGTRTEHPKNKISIVFLKCFYQTVISKNKHDLHLDFVTSTFSLPRLLLHTWILSTPGIMPILFTPWFKTYLEYILKVKNHLNHICIWNSHETKDKTMYERCHQERNVWFSRASRETHGILILDKSHWVQDALCAVGPRHVSRQRCPGGSEPRCTGKTTVSWTPQVHELSKINYYGHVYTGDMPPPPCHSVPSAGDAERKNVCAK